MKNEVFGKIYKAINEYDENAVKLLVIQSISEDIDPIETINILQNAISEIGDRFQKGELWLPDLMLAAKAMEAGMLPLIEEILKKGLKISSTGKVVIGTVYGDIHSIGKDMVATLLRANGFEVIDLGVNVESKTFIEAIKKYNPDILAMSALLTTTAQEQKKVIDLLIKEGLRNQLKIIVGGGPITSDFANDVGADGYSPTAPGGAQLARKLIKGKE